MCSNRNKQFGAVVSICSSWKGDAVKESNKTTAPMFTMNGLTCHIVHNVTLQHRGVSKQYIL